MLYLLGFFNPRNFSNEDNSFNAILATDYLHNGQDTTNSLVWTPFDPPTRLKWTKKAVRLEEPGKIWPIAFCTLHQWVLFTCKALGQYFQPKMQEKYALRHYAELFGTNYFYPGTDTQYCSQYLVFHVSSCSVISVFILYTDRPQTPLIFSYASLHGMITIRGRRTLYLYIWHACENKM